MRDAKLIGEWCDGVGVDGGVEVHADLDEEDGEKDGPLLACREGEAETVVAVFIVEHDLVGAGWKCDGLFKLVVL